MWLRNLNLNLANAQSDECIPLHECPIILSEFKLQDKIPDYCDDYEETVHCPELDDLSENQKKCLEYSKLIFEQQNNDEYIDRCKTTAIPFIFGGTSVSPGEFPHMTGIGIKDKRGNVELICGGSLISPKFVITTAYCVEADINVVRIGPDDIKIKEKIPHAKFESGKFYHDIALIELDKEVKLSYNIRPICLPEPNIKFKSLKMLKAVGWDSNDKRILHKVDLEYYSYEECQKYYDGLEGLEDGVSERNHLCYGDRKGKKDTCEGDAGGPLLKHNEDVYCSYTLIGITSAGVGCSSEIPGLYTNVVKNSSPIICDEEEETVMCPAVQESIEQKKCIQYLKSILVYDEDEEEYVDKCSTLAVPFIIGGQETIPHEFPHQALLGNTNDEWYCGGSLISEKFVLTAAHCLKPNRPVIVKLGMHSLRKDDEKVQKFGVKRVFLHPSYQKPAVYHDIGLIELKRRVKFTPYIRPICLPTTSDINFVEKLTATGFGLTKYEGEQSETLQKIELPKVSEESCNEKFINQNKSLPQGILADGQLCYGGELGRDACSGDSECIQYLKSILVYDEDEEEYVDKCSTLAVPYIIGGTAAMPHEFPHQALLENGNDQWFCGGTLVSEKFVLTAAHCLQKNPTSVIFGIHNIVNLLDEDENELETMQKIDVKRMFIHPAYKKPEVYNDIGLIELTRRVKLTPYVRPICLPTATEYKYLEKLTVTGYGLTENASSKDDLIDVLQKVELPHVSNEACKKIYNRPYVDTSKSLPHGPLPEKQICYGGKAGQDACYGDSVISILLSRLRAKFRKVTKMIKFFYLLLLIPFSQTQNCKKLHNCPQVFSDFQLKDKSLQFCDGDDDDKVVCPPLPPSIEEKKCLQYMKAILVQDPDTGEYSNKCTTLATPFIVGGTEAEKNEFPHQALLGNNVGFFCGGSLVSEKFVLTAAHCLTPTRPTKVMLGIHNKQYKSKDTQTFDVSQVIIHPSYKKPVVYNDIGLVQLRKKVKLTPYVRPICLPTRKQVALLPKSLLATGFGLTSYDGDQSNTLQKISLPLIPHQTCQSAFTSQKNYLPQGILAKKQLCYGGAEGHDTCQGDSGGPLQTVHKDVYCSYLQIGMTSVGVECGHGYPGIYTNILEYMDWVKEIIW
uniref:CSON004308 protein n=1 Tax=Culicoides sonorensis TaxID=179676 RepID=A0A336LWU0_CULSO